MPSCTDFLYEWTLLESYEDFLPGDFAARIAISIIMLLYVFSKMHTVVVSVHWEVEFLRLPRSFVNFELLIFLKQL